MENMVISLNAVLPLFLIIALGCAAKQLHILSDDAARQANGLCFKLFMAPLLFYNVYSTDLASAYSWKLLVFCVVGTLAEFAFGLLLIPHIEPSRPAQGVMLQAFCRPNIVLLGLPLSTALFGPENIGHIAFMLAVLVPLINILAVLALELIEAVWLFGLPPEKIQIVVQRQSIVHSAVQYSDNSIIAQLGVPDMRIPIQYALTYPARVPGVVPELDFTTLKLLTFDVADEETFRCLAACKKAQGNMDNSRKF